MLPIGILYEHPEWFTPLFAELDRRNLPYERIEAHNHSFNPAIRSEQYSLVVNRVSPSSYLRNHTAAIFFAREYLAYLEACGVPVLNGSHAFALEVSKARQIQLLSKLQIPHPRSIAINNLDQVVAAAAQLQFPLIVKPNIGGSGALMRRFMDMDELQAAIEADELRDVLGLDYTALVQEYHQPSNNSIVRVEVMDGKLLYAIRIHTDPEQSFNLCPADICQIEPAIQEQQADFEFCPVDAPAKKALKIEVAEPPDWVVRAVQTIFQEARIEIGGVEYLESARDGQIYLYDINALSNFVTDAQNLVGFDPFERFVDYLALRAGNVTAAV